MNRRVTDGPQDEYRRQLADLHRRADWENSDAARPDPDWEGHGSRPLSAIRELLEAFSRRPRGRVERGRD